MFLLDDSEAITGHILNVDRGSAGRRIIRRRDRE